MLFYLSKDKIKLNAQEIASFLIEELHQRSREKVEKVKEIIEMMFQLKVEHEKRIATFEFNKVQVKEREQTKSLHNKEIEACNSELTFSKRIKHNFEKEKTLTLHSKMATRVEELIKFKIDLARKNMILEHGDDYDPKKEAEKFIDFSFAQGGKNLPGRLTISKQVERANRHAHIAHKIIDYKKQGLKFAVKKDLPDESKVTYGKISNNVIKELNENNRLREHLQIFLSDDGRSSRDHKITKSIQSSKAKEKQVLTSRSLVDQRVKFEKPELNSLSLDQPFSDMERECRSMERHIPKLSRIDRASRAIAKKLYHLKTISSFTPKDIRLEAVQTAATTRTDPWSQNSPKSREKSTMPATNRSKKGAHTPFLTTESWLPKTKVT